MGIFRYDNPVMMVLNKIINCIFLSLVWLVCCIPVVTTGASTAALYHTVQKVIRDERGYVLTEFIHSFKGNVRQGIAVTIAGLLAAAVFVSDYWILEEVAKAGYAYGNAYVFFQILLILEVIYLVWVTACIARFENKMGQVLKNSCILAISHPGMSILIGLVLLFGCVLIYLIPLTILIMPVVMAWFISFPLEKLFKKYMGHCETEDTAQQ